MFRRILVPTDFSEPSDAALQYARMVAGKFGASLHLLHVFESPLYLAGAVSAEVYVADAAAIQAELMEQAKNNLAERVTAGDRERYAVTTDIVTGLSASSIVKYATEQHIDLIVMGTHGRRGMSHLLLGSVAEHVVRTAPCPVLTVRHMPMHSAEVPESLMREWVRPGG
jgi:nucleotide-binding universal stress UspA family protein